MFYLRFKELCQRKGISTSAGAIAAGFSKGTVSVWKKKYDEGIDVRPDADVLQKIVSFFGCTEAWLLGIDEETPADEGERVYSPALQAIIDELYGMTDEQLDKLLLLIQSAKKVL